MMWVPFDEVVKARGNQGKKQVGDGSGRETLRRWGEALGGGRDSGASI